MILEEALADVLACHRTQEGWREIFHTRTLTHLLQLGLHEGGDILNLIDEGDDNALGWELFGEALRPEAVFEVVVFYAAQLLNSVIATVVIGQDKPLR